MATPSSTDPPHSSPPYIPPQATLRHSPLSASRLQFLFREFCDNLKYVSDTPAFVFDELVFKLSDFFTAAFERERLDLLTTRERERVEHTATVERERLKHITALEKERLQHTTALERERFQHAIALERESLGHSTALEKCKNENKALQLSIDQLHKELAELKGIATTPKANNRRVSSGVSGGPIIGTFYTTEVREITQQSPSTSRTVSFSKPYSAPPNVVVGLNMLSIDCDKDICVNSHVKNLQNDLFEIHIDSSKDAGLYGGGCTWLEVEKNDPDFQLGTFSTLEDHPASKPQTLTSRHITFPRKYGSVPRVVVWLTGFHLNRENLWRVKTYATDITETGFTIHIDTWYSSVIYSASASWIAYPADKPNIFSGSFSTLDVRSWDNTQLHNRAYVNFDANIFTTPPRTFVALNLIEISQRHNLQIVTRASSVSTAGMTWHIDSWCATLLYAAGASYIALG